MSIHTPNSDVTSEHDVVLDVLAALEMFEGSVGSDETVIDEVTEAERNTLILALSNGDTYQIQIRTTD